VADGSGAAAKPAKKRPKRLTWEERYEQLKAFKKKYGHAAPSKKGEWESLYYWVRLNKKCKNGPYRHYHPLTKVQIDKLEKLGIDWCSNKTAQENAKRWDQNYERLKSFKEDRGHTQVPASGEWESLYKWLNECKHRKNGRYKNSLQLTKPQIQKLDKLGIDWATRRSA